MASAQTALPPTAETGFEGVILMSPSHGGPIRPGIANAAPLRNTEFVVANGEETVASFKTDGQGKFHVSLPPGHYVVSRKNWTAKVGRYGPFDVDVAQGEMTKVQWSCDSGMR
jgi:hypothetical protein